MKIKIFTQKKRSDIKYIKVENDSIAKLAEEAFNNGTDFIDVMNQYSTCKYAKERGGYIKGLLHNGYITGVGRDEELDKLIQEAKIGELNGPIKTDKGIHFFILENKVPELLKPYEEVKSHIQTRMRPIKDKQIYDDLITSLNDKYDFKIDNEVINSVNFNEKDYFINNGDKILTSSSNENLVFTINDVYHLFLRIPPQEKAEITTPRAQQAWIKRALDDQLYTQDAIDNNYKQRIEETDDYQQILKSLILRKTYTELIINKIEITEEDLNNNYNENIDKYTKKESRKVQLFKSATMKNAKKAKKSFLKADKKSKPEIRDEAIAKYCLEIDNEGIIEKVYKDKDIIPGFGKDENLKSAIWQTLPDNYSEIIETADGEFVFAYIIEETPAEITPLDNVKQKIEKFLRGSKSKEKFEEVAAELDSKYNLVKHYERLQLLLSADELFDLAEKSAKNGKYSDAVMYYDQIIKSYKNNNDDYKALFMKGFLYSEEMKENDKALETFKTLIKDYPAGDLHDSAQYMIDTLSGNAEPVFLD